MEELTIKAGSFTNLQYQLIELASERILHTVKANGGRMTIATIAEAWDDESSDVSETVKDRSIELSMEIEGNNIRIYPIDFCVVADSVSVVLMDYYGDHHQTYTGKMDDGNVLSIADFLTRAYGQF